MVALARWLSTILYAMWCSSRVYKDVLVERRAETAITSAAPFPQLWPRFHLATQARRSYNVRASSVVEATPSVLLCMENLLWRPLFLRRSSGLNP